MGTMNQSVCLSSWSSSRLRLRFSNCPLFLRPALFSPRRAVSRGHKLGSHTAYQSVPHVQWSTKPPPGPHEIFMTPCRRKSCDVRDCRFGVRFLCGHSDTAAAWWGKEDRGGGFRWLSVGVYFKHLSRELWNKSWSHCLPCLCKVFTS